MIPVPIQLALVELFFASRDRMVNPSLASGFYLARKFKQHPMRFLTVTFETDLDESD